MSNQEVNLATESNMIDSDNIKENDLSFQNIIKNNNNQNEINVFNLLNNTNEKNNESKFKENKMIKNIQFKRNIQRKPGIYKNIGNNFVFLGKYVFGPKNFLWLLILVMVSIAVSWSFWLYFLGNYYPIYIYIYCSFNLLATEYFILLCYITEPGIIPKNHPNFINSQQKENNNKIDEKENIPIILTKRKCEICNIFLPLGAFHCSECDNCIMELEDHYHFVSNCIGKRNFKYLLLFLFFASYLSLISILLNFIIILDVFIINYNETISYIYKGNKQYFYICLSFVILSLLILFSINCCTITFFFIGFGLFIKLWYQYVPINENSPSYYNPFILPIFIVAINFGIFAVKNFANQPYFITKKNIINKNAYNKEKKNMLFNKDFKLTINDELTRRKTIKERFMNLINLFCYKIDKSLIVPERDLKLI